MSTPITDKADISIGFPDKFYMGSFGRGSRFDLTADKEGIHLHRERSEGEKGRRRGQECRATSGRPPQRGSRCVAKAFVATCTH